MFKIGDLVTTTFSDEQLGVVIAHLDESFFIFPWLVWIFELDTAYSYAERELKNV